MIIRMMMLTVAEWVVVLVWDENDDDGDDNDDVDGGQVDVIPPPHRTSWNLKVLKPRNMHNRHPV